MALTANHSKHGQKVGGGEADRLKKGHVVLYRLHRATHGDTHKDHVVYDDHKQQGLCHATLSTMPQGKCHWLNQGDGHSG